MRWIARAAVKKSGQVVCREASPTNHNGDVPNGYVRRAHTPLRQWCDQIPILVIHPNQDPNLGDELKESDN
jgi:hypothetical protein